MASLPAKYDDQFDATVADIGIFEAASLAERGAYQQLRTLAEGGLPEPDDLTIRVDVYEGPGGNGYVVYAEAVVDDVTYRRSTNVGPETYRTHGWLEKPEEII